MKHIIIGFDRSRHVSRAVLTLQSMQKIANPILVIDEIEIAGAEFKKKLDIAIKTLAQAIGTSINDLRLLEVRRVFEKIHYDHVVRPLRLEQNKESAFRFFEVYNDAIKEQLYKQEKKSKLKPNHQHFTHNWRKKRR